MSKKFALFSLLVNSIFVYFLFRNSFSSYFFQDDWFTFSISRGGTIFDFLNFFIPRVDVIYYRPLGMQVYFYLVRFFFGLNPSAFHVSAYVTHICASFLVLLLSFSIYKNKWASITASFIYAVSSVHYIPFYWASTYPFVLGPFFLFFSFLLFTYFIKKPKKVLYLVSIFVFFLSLLTYEIAVLFPIILFFYVLLFVSTKKMRYVVPYFSFIFLYLFRFIFFRPPVRESYELGLNKNVLLNLFGYFSWALNWPEDIRTQMVKFMRFNNQFVLEFAFYRNIFIFSFWVTVLFLIVFPLVKSLLTSLIRKKIDGTYLRNSIFGIIWFMTGILPVIFFPVHAYSYYLPFSLAGLYITFLNVINKTFKKTYILIYLVLLFLSLITSYYSIEFNEKTYWATNRPKISNKLVGEAVNQKADDPSKMIFYVFPSSENKVSLADQYALRVIFNDNQIETIYGYPPTKDNK